MISDVLMLRAPLKRAEPLGPMSRRYAKEWETTVKRLGRWIDFENDYKTLDPTFMESVWWVFGELHQKGLVYKGFKVSACQLQMVYLARSLQQALLLHRVRSNRCECVVQVMPYSTGCSTALSNFEAKQNYKNVDDPSVSVAFSVRLGPLCAQQMQKPLKKAFWNLDVTMLLSVVCIFVVQTEEDPQNTFLVAWTTTPWTLPSNLALCVNPDFDYVKVMSLWWNADVCYQLPQTSSDT